MSHQRASCARDSSTTRSDHATSAQAASSRDSRAAPKAVGYPANQSFQAPVLIPAAAEQETPQPALDGEMKTHSQTAPMPSSYSSRDTSLSTTSDLSVGSRS